MAEMETGAAAVVTAEDLVRALGAVRDAMEADKAELSRLDGAIGDADHGVSMALGFGAVVAALAAAPPADPAGVFTAAARSFLDAVGASTGPLYATAFLRAGAASKGRASLDRDGVVAVLAAMARGIADRGKASPGEKTMLDAWAPAAAAAERAAARRARVAGLPRDRGRCGRRRAPRPPRRCRPPRAGPPASASAPSATSTRAPPRRR